MYFPYFLAYMAIGFGISLAVFFWALNNGQFSDQQRARYLPLESGAGLETGKLSTAERLQTVILIALACSGLIASIAAVAYVLIYNE
ncbi:MAG: cbb3-type cytochrome oxidase assembly protein [Desulfohalobiaceae bacterium]|nr:cbb3-type cytochrome oxidase assembly protein [Desulfohalobiaceae bacterium]